MPQEPESKEPTVTETTQNPTSSESVWQNLKGVWIGIRQIYDNHRLKIGVFGTISTVLFQILFSDEIETVLPEIMGSVSNFLTSNTGIAVLGTLIVALQAWELKLISAVGREVEEMKPLRPDGGDKVPPRDSKGRFKSSSSGPSIIFVAAVVTAGYLFGSQYGETEAIVGASVALLLLIWTDKL
ncbi:hypothetical protein [Haloarcula hispanica]|uniref:hypothetical protein n=1 Tax=Haloarcula hispanica TaxID=51589 RepID=UPI0011B6BFCC|nr:hypothetical protein [Haloarcula hispanica]